MPHVRLEMIPSAYSSHCLLLGGIIAVSCLPSFSSFSFCAILQFDDDDDSFLLLGIESEDLNFLHLLGCDTLLAHTYLEELLLFCVRFYMS